MRTVDLIAKKRDGEAMTEEEINFLIRLYRRRDPDYQMSAWLMAVVLKGMTREETAAVTMAMAHSGETLDLSGLDRVVVDKHSTGGGRQDHAGAAPLVASAGLAVGKMSGRGLGFTGGTLRQARSIPAQRSPSAASSSWTSSSGSGCGGQPDRRAGPGRRKLYTLRDVTATVPSMPLIAAS